MATPGHSAHPPPPARSCGHRVWQTQPWRKCPQRSADRCGPRSWFDPKASAQNVGTDDPALQREAEHLSEILRNQSHPANLVAVKSNQTPVLQNPALDAKVLFLASAEDEFEIIEQNPDWIHIRISGLSRGWLRRSGVELLDGSESVPAESPGTGVAAGNTPTPASRRAKAASPFALSSEEVGNFP